MERALRVIDGRRDQIEAMRQRLGSEAVTLGEQWKNQQIGPRGQRRLIDVFGPLLPGFGEHLLQVVAPAILVELGQRALNKEANEEEINLIGHLMKRDRNPAPVKHNWDLDIKEIKDELGLISQNWSIACDPEGHYVDIIGSPLRPTSSRFEDSVEPQYEEVNVATIYLEEPQSEQEVNAKFIYLAPLRIAKLIEMLEAGSLTSNDIRGI